MKKLLILLALTLTGCASLSQSIGFTCKGVIGAPYDPKDMSVDYVYEGSPAEKLGITKGDILLDLFPRHGSEGDIVSVVWEHKGVKYYARTKLVCLDDVRKWK